MNLEITDIFRKRHIGLSSEDEASMLKSLNLESIEQLIGETIPSKIRINKSLDLPVAQTEFEYLNSIRSVSKKNKVFKSYIGLGYSGTIVPPVIQRNIFENPGWYTQYTPYQAEISQGRLEALLNFQTVVSDLCGLEMANASLLDEGTAAAEAMIMLYHHKNKRKKGTISNKFLVSPLCNPQTLEILQNRAEVLDFEMVIGENPEVLDQDFFGALVAYPDRNGRVQDFTPFCTQAHEKGVMVVFVADLLSLCLLKSPGEMGADIAVGNTQRFGVPMGFGGPHAAYFATHDTFKRSIPGRIIGVSEDSQGNKAYRMALQTREQHIKREKATSNICTAQALLAIMAGMYAVYHGPNGLKDIARRIHGGANWLNHHLSLMGYQQNNSSYFDTLSISVSPELKETIKNIALKKGINLDYSSENLIGISIGEDCTISDLKQLASVFSESIGKKVSLDTSIPSSAIPENLKRSTPYLTHPVFNRYQSETEMMRYIKRLENRDLSLTLSMIPLGSCTMKLNAATQLMPLSWPEFANIHPFSPKNQTEGYRQMITELESYLSTITGFTATSLQPNSGAQGEYAGLLVIRAYHHDREDLGRDIVIIPSSAHGTNPASAVMAGMKVVVTQCDENGNINIENLKEKVALYKDRLAALMVTYPSTHGVFEEGIIEVCDLIHENGGLVYMDGANMNAQVGLTSPAAIGADVCHLNLHKTFAIPHGGGGPGMGPICVNDKLKPYLPNHPFEDCGGEKGIKSVSAAPWGSASILLISYAYIRLLGPVGLTASSRYAILNANYLKNRLSTDYEVLYEGKNGRVAHEFILDFRAFKADTNISVEDVSKRLMDYGFHAPTVSFPVAGTLMIEPTESESLWELDRFVQAMKSIKSEIEAIKNGSMEKENNPLSNAPHTMAMVISSEWDKSYTREIAAFPSEYVVENKFWPKVGRINNTLGDKVLICTCPPIEEYEEALV